MLEFLGVMLLLFLVFVAVMLWIGYRLARRVMRNARAFAQGFAGAGAAKFPTLPDPRWIQLGSHLDRRGREQARRAQGQITALLAERRSEAVTPEEAQLLLTCERRVPELLDTCLDRCRTARPGERCDYATTTLERLVRIGEEADEARAAIRARDDGRLDTMHRYFDTVAQREP